jgi:hypothetical protein
MGFWNDTCAISNLPIHMGDEVWLLELEERHGIRFPKGLPKRMTYAEYGEYDTGGLDGMVSLVEGDNIVAVRVDVWDAIVAVVREWYPADSEPKGFFQWAFGRTMRSFNETDFDADLIRQCHCITLWTHQTRFSWAPTEHHRGSQQNEADKAGEMRRSMWRVFLRASEELRDERRY